ncbi:hypothetical protein DIPPA_18804 [Diplonema papillatum]|nr:hypothetical protein DIPPA_18804 [Diplonema papillatum]
MDWLGFHNEEHDNGHGPEQSHTCPGGDAQHPPIFVVPQPVRTRRRPSRPIQLGQENDLNGLTARVRM